MARLARANSHFINDHKARTKNLYGFVADPELPLWKNVEDRIGSLDAVEFQARPSNMTCHNLLRHRKLPPGTTQLLGHGLNFCVKPASTNDMITRTFKRLTKDIRRMYALREEIDGGDYIPTIYIKSKWYFDQASGDIEKEISVFKANVKMKITELQRKRHKKPKCNLSPACINLLQFLKNNDHYIVIQGDKNLGPCILERELYIFKAFEEHLGNERNYKPLSEVAVKGRQRGLQYLFRDWISKYRPRLNHEKPTKYTCISKAEYTFLTRALKHYPDKLARFRMMAKVHKTPWKMRPVICCAGTFMNCWSKWLDYWLQTLKPFVPTYVSNGEQVLDQIGKLKLTPCACLFTTDAVSMYNNIDTDHAITVITWWIRDLENKNLLPEDFPSNAVISAMTTIMKNNIFEFGDLYFLQLLGTAMGTSAAVMWATLYYAYHEVHTLLPNHGHNLQYFIRYIDDILGIWTGNLTTDWKAFSEDINNFGILKWDISDVKPSLSVNFLDMTLSIENGKFISRTFQKQMNLHLYIPPSSEHPASCIKGTIFSLVSRYFKQNTYQKDFVYFTGLLYVRTLHRGWDRELIRKLILEATSRVENPHFGPPLPAEDLKNTAFLHFQFHKDGISRLQIRAAYEEHLNSVLKKEINITRAIVAFSRPKNIGDFVTKAKLHQATGLNASTIMGKYIQGLDPF